MRIHIGSDHAGLELKAALVEYLLRCYRANKTLHLVY